MKHNGQVGQVDPARIHEVLSACGVEASERQCDLLARHADMVREANESMNLTRITEPEAMIQLHIADSLAFLPFIQQLNGNVVDVGSGAGYPGIPLAILGYRVALCESVKKKAVFLESAIEDLGLQVPVCSVRAEELAVERPSSADVVVVRAVSALASLVELAAPLLKDGGRLIALKGPVDPTELLASRRAAVLCGMKLDEEKAYTLPGGESRTVLSFIRVGRPQTSLPRRPGMAQRHPLG